MAIWLYMRIDDSADRGGKVGGGGGDAINAGRTFKTRFMTGVRRVGGGGNSSEGGTVTIK